MGSTGPGGGSGMAHGFYDRFLAKNMKLRKIGIAFSCQEYESLPADKDDIPMDGIITEEGIVYSPDGIL